jgi:DNA-binding beta-propeller fold protein YncE
MTCRMGRRLAVWIVSLALLASRVICCLPGQAQAIVSVVDLGSNGGGVAVNPITNRLYVALPGQLNVYDAQTYALTTTIPLPQTYVACEDVAVNVSTNRVYATGFRTYVVDGNSNTVLANLNQEGSELAVNPATNRVYITNYSFHSGSAPFVVRVLDGASNTWLPDISIASSSSYQEVHLAVNPAANRVYVTYTGDDDLRVLDATTYAEVGRVDFSTISYVAVNPRTGWIYVEIGTDGVAVLDGTSYARLATIPTLSGRLRLNPRTDRLYGADSASTGTVLRIADLASNRVTGYVYLEGSIANFDVHPESGKICATHASYPTEWAKKMTVIQDVSPFSPAPEPPPPRLVATLDLPADGEAVGVNTVTNRAYAGLEGGVAVYDAITLAPLGYVDLTPCGTRPYVEDVGVDEVRNRIYAVSDGGAYAIDGATDRCLGKFTGGDRVAVNSVNGRVYIADMSPYIGVADVVRIYDGPTLTSIRTIRLGSPPTLQSVSVAVNPTTGFAYATYSFTGDLYVISPATDDVVQQIDYSSAGLMAVNPATNRIYVTASRGSQSGIVVLDGNTHAELVWLSGIYGKLATNPATNRLYGTSGSGLTVFSMADGTSGGILGYAFVDGSTWDYAVHPGLGRLYVLYAAVRNAPARALAVIQDMGGPPAPTPTATPTRRPPITPTSWLYLPVLRRN